MMAQTAFVSRRFTRILFGFGVSCFGMASVAYVTGVRLNTTGSIPPGFYKISRGPVTRGNMVLACLPSEVAAFARARDYVPSGSCADGSAPVGKIVAAMAGDTVDVSSHGVAVNGALVPNSAPLRYDTEGRLLPAMRLSRHVVGASEVWLVSSYSSRSFDSRYFGGIDASRVITRIRPLLTSR
jgi:conjugative transfer signal peptidase TraF